MLATLADFERAPRILRLNVAGQPVEWVTWQEAVCLYARDLVVWTLGDAIVKIRGGHSRFDGTRSTIDIHSIVACEGRVVPPARNVPPLDLPGPPEPLPVDNGVARIEGPIGYPVLFDRKSKSYHAWKIKALPTSFVVGRDGTVHYWATGAMEWDTPEVIDTIKSLLEQVETGSSKPGQ